MAAKVSNLLIMRYFAPDAGIDSISRVEIGVGSALLRGDFAVPPAARAIVLFAHGSGSGRHSPRNRFVARQLYDVGLATMLFDLLTREEEAVDHATRHLRFDISLLTSRLVEATSWVLEQSATRSLPIGYFGASTGAAAALVAAAELGDTSGAVVSRGGRPDLAGDALSEVRAATLLIVGGLDDGVIDLNREAFSALHCEKALEIVPGASHLFEESGTLDKAARLAAEWFLRHLNVARGAAQDQRERESRAVR